MPPKGKGRSRAQPAGQQHAEHEEEKKDPPREEDKEVEPPEEEAPPAGIAGDPPPNGPAVAPPPEVDAVAPPPGQEQAPEAPPEMVARPRAPYVFVPTEKISTLTKNICKLAHGNFAAWQKAIDEIAYYRRWDKERLLNESFTWDQVEEQDPFVNQQRRDAFWVLTSSMPTGSDFYHLRTGIKEGDANALYKKVIRTFLAKNGHKTEEN